MHKIKRDYNKAFNISKFHHSLKWHKPNKINKKKTKEMKMKQRKYNAILENFSTLGNGLTSVVNDGVGIILDNPSEVIIIPNLHRLAHSQFNPRHSKILLRL